MSLKQIVAIASDGTAPSPGPADHIEWALPFSGGTWGILAIFRARPDGGKGAVTLELDEPDGSTTALAFGSFDTYAAAAAWDTVQTTGWLGGAGNLATVDIAGLHSGRLRVTADDKHASSSGYVCEIQALMFWRMDANPFTYPDDYWSHFHLLTPLTLASDSSGWQNASEVELPEVADVPDAAIYDTYCQQRVHVAPFAHSGYAFDFDVSQGRAYSTADADWIEWTKTLAAGTYSLELWYYTWDQAGIIDIAVDGSVEGSLDTYAATAQSPHNGATVTGIAVVGDGLHTVRFTTNGKNAASTGYYILLESEWSLRRTGA